MEDKTIISLYLQRNEEAIVQTEEKYGKMLTAMAMRILSDENDVRECVNDAYLKVWNSIPPTIPNYFSAFLCTVIRSISIDRMRAKKTSRRIANEYVMSLQELTECIASNEEVQAQVESELLEKSIERYLSGLKKEQRQMFLCRYYFADSIKSIAGYFGCSESRVKSLLFRLRAGLKKQLQQEGFFV